MKRKEFRTIGLLTLTVLVWIFVIVNVEEENVFKASVCGIMFFLTEIAVAIYRVTYMLIKHKAEEEEENRKVWLTIAMELKNK